jgi:hypothetical protein
MTATSALTRCVAAAVAICLAGQPAWGHTFPPVRTVVVQVERCELAVMIGYRPASGESTDTFLARVASQPKSQRPDTARTLLATQALQPLAIALDGKPLVPTSVRAKIGLDPGGTRPMVVVLLTYATPAGGKLSVTSRDPRSTRISWTDRDSGRVDLEHAPGQAKWFVGVASFLLSLAGPPGASCGPPSTSASSSP